MIVVAAAVVLATDDMMICYFAISNITVVERLPLLFVLKKKWHWSFSFIVGSAVKTTLGC